MKLSTVILQFLLCNILILFVAYLFWSKETWCGIFTRITVFIVVELICASSICIKMMKPSPSNICIEGKKVIITGGSSGIGFSLAQQMISAGASFIVLIARNENRLKACVDELTKLKTEGQSITYLSLDLSMDPANIKLKINILQEFIGGIDILVNCAGYSIPGEFQALDIRDFSEMMNINYLATVNITHAVVPHMINQSFGQIVFLSSVGGQLGIYGFTAYASSKYAIRGFAECLYAELRPFGIGVCLVFPPDTETPGLKQENKRKPKVTKLISEQGGLWKSDDVARIILNGIISRKYLVGFGSDGYFLNALTCGAAFPSSLFEFWSQFLLMPIVRVYMLFMQTYFTSLIEREHKKKER